MSRTYRVATSRSLRKYPNISIFLEDSVSDFYRYQTVYGWYSDKSLDEYLEMELDIWRMQHTDNHWHSDYTGIRQFCNRINRSYQRNQLSKIKQMVDYEDFDYVESPAVKGAKWHFS